MPKIQIEVQKEGSDVSWTEDYTIDHNDPAEWAAETIDRFNRSRKPGEKIRKLIGVTVLDPDGQPRPEHNWEKSNLATIVRGKQNYDTVKCTNCGITGKRFGLSSGIKIDSKYRAKKYEFCKD